LLVEENGLLCQKERIRGMTELKNIAAVHIVPIVQLLIFFTRLE